MISHSLIQTKEMDTTILIFFKRKLRLKGYELKTSKGASHENCERVFFFDEPSVIPYKG